MPWNSAETRDRIFAHYLKLCKIPGWKHYAWEQVKKLDETVVYCGIKEYIVEQMKNG